MARWIKYALICCCFFVNNQISSGKKDSLRSGSMGVWYYRAFNLSEKYGESSAEEGTKITTSSVVQLNFSTGMITKPIDIRGNPQLMYVDIDAELTSCVVNFTCYFQVLIYQGKPLFASGNAEMKNFLSNKFSPVYNITVSKLSTRETRKFAFRRNSSSKVTFGITASGGSGLLYSMNLYYYYCEEKIYKGLKLPNTTSPENGFKAVMVTCSENSSPASRTKRLEAYCHYNGTWTTDDNTECLCNKGFETSTSKACIRTPKTPGTSMTVRIFGFDIPLIYLAAAAAFLFLTIAISCVIGLRMKIRRRNRRGNSTLSQLQLADRSRTTNQRAQMNASGETNESRYFDMSVSSFEDDVVNIRSMFLDPNGSDLYYDYWEVRIDRIIMLNALGHGSFGTVNKARVKPVHGVTSVSDNIVAVKRLKDKATRKDKEDFMNELDVMKKLSQVPHRFVVQLFGCCTRSEPFLLILEYLPGGDLLGYLRKSRGHEDYYNTGELVATSRLNETDLLRFAWMVSDGMVYLSSQGVVHRDLAARNVLVGKENVCKVSDFGLAREGRYERKTKARLPVKWMAPEDLFEGVCTSMSDVWAYGILLWEIFTIGDSPYPRVKGPDVVGLIESGYRMSKPSHCSDKLYAIMLKCWNDDPVKRPTFTEIRSFFKKHLRNHQICLDLSKYAEDEYVNFDVAS